LDSEIEVQRRRGAETKRNNDEVHKNRHQGSRRDATKKQMGEKKEKNFKS